MMRRFSRLAGFLSVPFAALPAKAGNLDLRPTIAPSEIKVEAAAVYWYSRAKNNWGFTNGSPLDGSPTSTLDNKNMSSHTGEIEARLSHTQMPVFMRGRLGAGGGSGGKNTDRDFLAGQISFSDTTSKIGNGHLSFATLDFGATTTVFDRVRLGAFLGYTHYSDQYKIKGLLLNPVDKVIFDDYVPGTLTQSYNTIVGRNQVQWHGLRVGVEGQAEILPRLFLNAEFAYVPNASYRQDDDHVLRQLDILSNGHGWGIQTQAMLRYMLTETASIGVGARAWHFEQTHGGKSRYFYRQYGVGFGDDKVDTMKTDRIGTLIEARAAF
jgi:hypothetical protein